MLPGGGGSAAYHAQVNQPKYRAADGPSREQLLSAVGLVSNYVSRQLLRSANLTVPCMCMCMCITCELHAHALNTGAAAHCMCIACALHVHRHSSRVSASLPRYCEIGRLVSRPDPGPDLDPGPGRRIHALALALNAYPRPPPSPQVGVRGLHPGPAAERARPGERWRRRQIMYIRA